MRVTDTDRTSGNRSLDTVYIDQLYVRTENGGGTPATPPAAASSANAVALSASGIRVTWNSNSSDELGFRVERSQDGVNFSEASSVAAGQTSFDDSGLSADTTYYYQVVTGGWSSAVHHFQTPPSLGAEAPLAWLRLAAIHWWLRM